ncbi:uncharacterized protein YbjT (DUF2867 family) [Sphingomonas zeicaulis]|uniref:NmrA family NAD(P)-binding protein n=1 Tax=Sphingomonas zeicaulis TaxID=1632740 RepID=UPI003D22B86C
MLPGLGLEQHCLTYFTQPDQPTQFVAVADIGNVVAAIFARPERFAGKRLEVAGAEITGRQLEASLSVAAGQEIGYQRFPENVLAENVFLGDLARLFDSGRISANADIAALRALVPGLHSFDSWLDTEGASLLRRALQAGVADVALR